MKTIIITEGGRLIGFGHIMRCLSLSDALKEKAARPALIVNGDETVGALLKGEDCEVFDWLRDKEKLFSFIKDADIAVVDSYQAGLDFYKTLAGSVKIAVYLDDNGRIGYPRGIVVNGNIYAGGLSYPARQDVKYLLGAAYAPLRKPFWAAGDRTVRRDIKRILVIMGGCDTRGLTPAILDMLERKFPSVEKDIIVGCRSVSGAVVENTRSARTTLLHGVDARQIRNLMLDSDIAVSAGGQTLYELAATGTPTIAVNTAENQRKNIEAWSDVGFADNAGSWDSGTLVKNIEKCLLALADAGERKKKMEIGRSRVDGLGALRIAESLMSFADKAQADGVILRKASQDDCYDILQWRNDEEVRRWCFNSEKIGRDEHDKWFNKIITGNNTVIYIALNKYGDKIGQIRFEKNSPTACVSVNLNPRFIGKRLGHRIIRMGTEAFFTDHPAFKEITAECMGDNTASNRSFQKAGYIFSRKIAKNGKKANVYAFIRK